MTHKHRICVQKSSFVIKQPYFLYIQQNLGRIINGTSASEPVVSSFIQFQSRQYKVNNSLEQFLFHFLLCAVGGKVEHVEAGVGDREPLTADPSIHSLDDHRKYCSLGGGGGGGGGGDRGRASSHFAHM